MNIPAENRTRSEVDFHKASLPDFTTATPSFFASRPARSLQTGRLHLLGIGFDGAASFRKGASKGPGAIRQVSAELESYSPLFDMDLHTIWWSWCVNLVMRTFAAVWDRGSAA